MDQDGCGGDIEAVRANSLGAVSIDKAEQASLLQRLGCATELEVLLAGLLDRVVGAREVEGALVNLLDEPRENLICEAIRLPQPLKPVERTYRGLKFPLDRVDINVECFKKGRSRLLDAFNVTRYPGTTQNRFQGWGMRGVLVLPVVVGSDPLGTLMVFTRRGSFDAADEQWLEQQLAGVTARLHGALYLKHLTDKEQDIAAAGRIHEGFLRLIAGIKAADSTERVYGLIGKELLERFDFDMSGLLMLRDDALVLRHLAVADDRHSALRDEFAAHSQDQSFELDQADGASAIAFLQDTLLLFKDVRELGDLRMAAKDRANLARLSAARTLLIVPIRFQGRPVGVIWLISLERLAVPDDAECRVAQLFASLVGSVLADKPCERAVPSRDLQRQIQRLRVLAGSDALTGFKNSRAFGVELARQVRAYRRDGSGAGLALVVVELDGYSQLEQMRSRTVIAMLLQEVARRLRRKMRKLDVACRNGEATFAVILPNCDQAGARVFADRVRESIAQEAIEMQAESLRVTASLGCAAYQPGEDARAFVERAERALFLAKERGRDRVELYAD